MTVSQLIEILDDMDAVRVALDGTITAPNGDDYTVADFDEPLNELEALAEKISEMRKALAWAKKAPNYREAK